jgi:Spy/CpxP family protein refolding chaperone
MSKVSIVVLLLVAVSSHAFAQSKHSAYVGQEKRIIKALSSEDVEAYLSGQGMGFAKAAELNHYPGPKHVLQLAEELHLSKGQMEKTRAVFDEMQSGAVSIGRLVVEKEEILDSLFANQEIDETELSDIVVEIGRLEGELRAVHLKAHLDMRKILTTHQIDRYDEIRGYTGDEGEILHRHPGDH